MVPAERSVVIAFHHLNGHEMDLLEDLYARAGVELTPKVRRAFQGYLEGNPRGKHGSVRYELQRHFGVSPDELAVCATAVELRVAIARRGRTTRCRTRTSVSLW